MLNAKTYVDVESGRAWSNEGTLKEAEEEIVSGTRNCEQYPFLEVTKVKEV